MLYVYEIYITDPRIITIFKEAKLSNSKVPGWFFRRAVLITALIFPPPLRQRIYNSTQSSKEKTFNAATRRGLLLNEGGREKPKSKIDIALVLFVLLHLIYLIYRFLAFYFPLWLMKNSIFGGEKSAFEISGRVGGIE